MLIDLRTRAGEPLRRLESILSRCPNYDEETATRLQILDNSDFGPGKIDGRMGEFSRKALMTQSAPTPHAAKDRRSRSVDAGSRESSGLHHLHRSKKKT